MHTRVRRQCVVYLADRKVVDLAGSNARQPQYDGNSLQCVFGCGQVMEAVAVAILVDRGLLAHDDLVATHWPEFAKGASPPSFRILRS
jgi:CubicO group peptidase (beta-lactamase class C family)